MKQILDKTYGTHDALEDVKALGELLSHACTQSGENGNCKTSSFEDIIQFSFHSLQSVCSMLFHPAGKSIKTVHL